MPRRLRSWVFWNYLPVRCGRLSLSRCFILPVRVDFSSGKADISPASRLWLWLCVCDCGHFPRGGKGGPYLHCWVNTEQLLITSTTIHGGSTCSAVPTGRADGGDNGARLNVRKCPLRCDWCRTFFLAFLWETPVPFHKPLEISRNQYLGAKFTSAEKMFGSWITTKQKRRPAARLKPWIVKLYLKMQ